MRSLVKVRFIGSKKEYDYYAEGSSNELAGARAVIVDTPLGRTVARVVAIRPLSEQVYKGKLKPITQLIYKRREKK